MLQTAYLQSRQPLRQCRARWPQLPNRNPLLEISRRRTVIMSQSADGNALADYICQGPLLQAASITSDDVHLKLQEWRDLAQELISNLSLPSIDALDAGQRQRIFHFYLPIYFWLETQLLRHKQTQGGQPLVLGMSAPQGSGKTTLCEQLQALLKRRGYQGIDVSLDDFYLTFADQQALAKENPGNRLLQLRSNAGTHDLPLAKQTLQQLISAGASGDAVPVVCYDKSKNEGKGDRAPKSDWPQVKGPLDVILLEGWMLGFSPIDEAEAAQCDPNLVTVNARLPAYQEALDAQVDAWLIIRVPDPTCVYKWRLEAEEKQKARGKPGMTEEQVHDFVDRYMPAYKAYLPGLYRDGPKAKSQGGPLLVVEVDKIRGLAGQQPQPKRQIVNAACLLFTVIFLWSQLSVSA